MSRAASLRCSMSACTLAIRPRRSSAEIGLAPAVMDFSSAPAALGSALRAPTASSEAPAAPVKNTRLDGMVIPFCRSTSAEDTSIRDNRDSGTYYAEHQERGND